MPSADIDRDVIPIIRIHTIELLLSLPRRATFPGFEGLCVGNVRTL